MACEILEINSADCAVSDGGIKFSFITDFDNLDPDGMTITADEVITDMLLTGAAEWAIFEYDTETDTAYYNQEGERTNNKHVYNQTAFMSFAGITVAKRKAAEALRKCCSLVAVHFTNTGIAMVQGVETTGLATFQETKKKAKATVNIMTDTGANEDRIEITVISQSRQASPITTMPKADFLPA